MLLTTWKKTNVSFFSFFFHFSWKNDTLKYWKWKWKKNHEKNKKKLANFLKKVHGLENMLYKPRWLLYFILCFCHFRRTHACVLWKLHFWLFEHNFEVFCCTEEKRQSACMRSAGTFGRTSYTIIYILYYNWLRFFCWGFHSHSLFFRNFPAGLKL